MAVITFPPVLYIQSPWAAGSRPHCGKRWRQHHPPLPPPPASALAILLQPPNPHLYCFLLRSWFHPIFFAPLLSLSLSGPLLLTVTVWIHECCRCFRRPPLTTNCHWHCLASRCLVIGQTPSFMCFRALVRANTLRPSHQPPPPPASLPPSIPPFLFPFHWPP